MYKNKKILAIIPARGGSKGVVNKNMKLLDGEPLIAYILKILSNINLIDRIVVTSDDSNILNYCEKYKSVKCIKRSKELSKDEITLDPVVYDAFSVLSQKENFDYIFTFQPTSPLLKELTINKAIKKIVDEKMDTLISVVDDRHLSWSIKDGKPSLNYKKRVNRQKLPSNFKETGGIIACSSEVIAKNNRIGNKIVLYEISEEESIDIDNYYNWILAEEIIKQPNVGIIVTGNKDTGLGHVYRQLTLANRLRIKPIFFTEEKNDIAIRKIKDSYYPIVIYKNINELKNELNNRNIQLLINDNLDSTVNYLFSLKDNNGRYVVTFEDLGLGVEKANLCFNALYEHSRSNKNKFYGYKYYCLRDEFLFCKKHKVKDKARNILITFGGSDPNNLTEKILNWLKPMNNIDVEVIFGLGYDKSDKVIKNYSNFRNINFYKNVIYMSKHMNEADIIITSNGRTVYEAVSLAIPTISISQNERELKHTFGEITGTIINLGLAQNMEKEKFFKNFKELKNNKELRKNLKKKMLELNLKGGIERVITLILNGYNNWRKKK